MVDQYGREICYLRVSVTDRCNLRCTYCAPQQGCWYPQQELLTDGEICRLVRLMAALGIHTVRITGGEPLVRQQLTDLIGSIRQMDGVRQVKLTTNGMLLAQQLPELLQAGLSSVNISLDTLDRRRFQAITGVDGLPQVLAGLACALEASVHTKINCVLQQGAQEAELYDLAQLAKEAPLDVRFIEMMPLGRGRQAVGVSNQVVLERLRKRWPDLSSANQDAAEAGPASYYQIPGFQGKIGLISPLQGNFCGSCNRIRLTATGFLKCCLASNQGRELRQLLREQVDDSQLLAVIQETIWQKPRQHHFAQLEQVTEQRDMYQIGG